MRCITIQTGSKVRRTLLPGTGLPNSRRLLTNGTPSGRPAGLLAVIETPQALEGNLLRAQSQDDVKRRAQRCIDAVQDATRLAVAWGW